jgi:hypothetical protein
MNFVTLLQRCFHEPDIRRVEYVQSMSAVPQARRDVMYVVGSEGALKWALISCPCRCGDTIDVNLMPNHYPHWALFVRSGYATVWPSLHAPKERCGSHFWICDNVVYWVERPSSSRKSRLKRWLFRVDDIRRRVYHRRRFDSNHSRS